MPGGKGDLPGQRSRYTDGPHEFADSAKTSPGGVAQAFHDDLFGLGLHADVETAVDVLQRGDGPVNAGTVAVVPLDEHPVAVEQFCGVAGVQAGGDGAVCGREVLARAGAAPDGDGVATSTMRESISCTSGAAQG